uniref:Uncharacterized protein n=1 Tax=Anopheles quadriannulatus TaxID=34691 RepID=A0A182WVB8_ANOQN
MVGSGKVESDLSVSFLELLEAIGKAKASDRVLYDAFAPVRKRIWRKKCIRWLSGAVCLAAIGLAVYYIPWVNWQVTAVGRLIMIELLPYWDWTPLYRGKCLIAKAKETDAPKNPRTAKAPAIARMVDLLASNGSLYGNGTARGWFVQLRNCALPPIKKTRTMFEKPYFYATHWEPPYTNWLLLSRAFHPGAPELTPNMAGLVIVHQMRARLSVTLRPRTECKDSCRALSLTLHQQQSLLFSTSLWNFSYLPSDGNETSVTFITETYESL